MRREAVVKIRSDVSDYKTVDHWNNTCVHFIYFPKNGVLCE